jgi:hypothetical protein
MDRSVAKLNAASPVSVKLRDKRRKATRVQGVAYLLHQVQAVAWTSRVH